MKTFGRSARVHDGLPGSAETCLEYRIILLGNPKRLYPHEHMHDIAIHGYSSLEPPQLQVRLVDQILDCRGWVLEEKQLTPLSYQIRFEVELWNIVEMYSALQRTGVQFTRTAHRALTEMCLCQKHLPEPEQIQIITITLRVGMLQEENVRFRRFLRSRPA